MQLAVDSLPLTRDIFSARDYSGLQVYGLEHVPLHKKIRAVQGWEDGRFWRAEVTESRWPDGAPVTPAEYLAGLNQVLRAQPQLRNYLRKILKRVTHSVGTLTLEFYAPVAAGAAFFELPNWVPYRAGHRSADFSLRPADGGWTIRHAKIGEGFLNHVSSPEANDRLFRDGRLDYSADTALPLTTLDANVHRRDTGLFGTLVYSSRMTDRRALAVTQALGDLQFSPEIEAAYPSLRSAVSSRVEAQALRLAYDDFYPNGEVCAQIAALLQSKGWHVELVKDDYYRPAAEADLKFMILRHIGPRGVFPSLTMAALPRAAVRPAELAEKVALLEAGAEYQTDWLKELHLGFPLFTIPSLYRSRLPGPNPLLEVFA